MLWSCIWKTGLQGSGDLQTTCLKALLKSTSYGKYWCSKLLNPTECQLPRSPWWRGCLAGPRRWCCPCCRPCRWWQWTGCSTARTSACSACPSCCCCSNTPLSLRSSTVFLLVIGSGNIFEGWRSWPPAVFCCVVLPISILTDLTQQAVRLQLPSSSRLPQYHLECSMHYLHLLFYSTLHSLQSCLQNVNYLVHVLYSILMQGRVA